jgi:aspartyl-tRNA(Asn)/glutamyl-tRNA(Gln) amidotransferase subunit C
MPKSDKKINIDYVAQLARLELSEEDKSKLSGQLNDILVYFEKLNSVNVEGIEPMAHAHKVDNVWREGDEPGAVFSKDILKKMSPESREDQVVVPKVVE